MVICNVLRPGCHKVNFFATRASTLGLFLCCVEI